MAESFCLMHLEPSNEGGTGLRFAALMGHAAKSQMGQS
jgi:hypothetical protein